MFETLNLVTREVGDVGAATGTLAPGKDPKMTGRAEVDTSAPFESVREAVDRFGGSALWKSQLKPFFSPEKHHCFEEVELMKVGEQTLKLEMDLIVKERETLDVLKELEMTKRIVDGLKLKLQNETSEVIKIPERNSDDMKVHPILDTEGQRPRNLEKHVESVGPSIAAKQSPGLILMELKQAKLNLNRTTSDLAGIRASVELLNSKLEGEKLLLEKTRDRLSSNTAKVSSLEEDLNRTISDIQQIKEAKGEGFGNSSDISSQIKHLNSEKDRFKKMTEAAVSEVSKLTAEIEQTKAGIKTAQIRCLVAKKMEEAARTAEAFALSEIKALTNSKNSAVLENPSEIMLPIEVAARAAEAVALTNSKSSVVIENPSEIMLPIEEYVMLARKAQEADEISRKKIEAAMLQVEAANRSKQDLLMKVEEATAEVETSRKALEEALNREEAANRGKVAVEAALRRWRSEHVQKRRSGHSSTKFKNPYPTHHRRDSRMLDVNGLSLVNSGSRSPFGPTLSIGQILSRKLMGPEEYEAGRQHKVSLGQILSRRHGALSPQRTDDGTARKSFLAKRKKFGFAGFSLHSAKQNKKGKKKKRQVWNPQVNCRAKLV